MAVSEAQMKEAMDFIASLLARLEDKKGEREYIFRGVTRRYNAMKHYKEKKDGINSTLYRWATDKGKDKVFNDKFSPHRIEKDTVEKARRLFPSGAKNVEILTDMQHYGGRTNLIDFSHNIFIALFFACNGEFGKDGELIMLEKSMAEEAVEVDYSREEGARPETIWLITPTIVPRSGERVRFQSSIFARPKRGYIDEKACTIEPIQKKHKRAILAYLEKYHDITEDSVYNDMFGFMGNENNYETAAFYFYKGAAKYERGRKKDAAKWYRKAAGQGLIEAQFSLALMYYKGEGVKKDKKAAAKWWQQAAEQGDVSAQFNLGLMYDNGEGVLQDYREAAEWYRKAAEQRDAEAQFNLGQMYRKGEGVLQDNHEAVKWYRKAAEQGHAKAQNNLGAMYRKGEGVLQDYREAVAWYRKAAEQGDARAQYNLGVMYYKGEGVLQDYREAAEWYRKAAEQGDASAQNNLGVMHANGEGVNQDKQEAAKWYRKAAAQGNIEAQFNLGVMYGKGKGVKQDDREAQEKAKRRQVEIDKRIAEKEKEDN